jgi:hypothetical protein
MFTNWSLFAVTLDGRSFALVRAFDAVEALDLAFGLYTARCRGPMVGSPAPVIAAAEHRRRLAARVATEDEAVRFEDAARRMTGDVPLTAFVGEATSVAAGPACSS